MSLFQNVGLWLFSYESSWEPLGCSDIVRDQDYGDIAIPDAALEFDQGTSGATTAALGDYTVSVWGDL